jgi:hypothetical protein
VAIHEKMTAQRWLLAFVLLELVPRSEGYEMKIQLNETMFTPHPGLDPSTDIADAIDGDPSETQWCPNTSESQISSPWFAIDLQGVFLISTVRVSFHMKSGELSAVFVGNDQSLSNGKGQYECGKRLENGVEAARFYNFTCNPPRWAFLVNIQRNSNKHIRICEVEVYYTPYTKRGIDISFASGSSIDSSQTIILGDPLVCSSVLVSNSRRLLNLQWLFPNGTAVSHDSNVNVTNQYNSTSLIFISLAAELGNYTCSYTLNGKQRSRVITVSGEV